ncbi:gliding motility-associated C-terminal domain-containing protein [Flavobacterium fluvii]|uniref:Gliding motility-associated C-terminal domain-containing protein n=1 Tax=Flavobacterium fluvii TaxID=468056 RepID=A0A1M5J7E2_9FLAO|nr:T9SS type B sorting domain-containing protein [Flavobacterium fluvii]SHG36285.1 gliding motility-associated C-terminal domain-containing protein [Flavobacterium fluvii]
MMEKLHKSFSFLFLIATLSITGVFAKNSIGSNAKVSLATAPPIVYSPVIYWQNCSKPLTAIPSAGGTLNWYLTNLPAEISTPIAPTPITTTIGSTVTYYVTQTIGGVESSPRTPIVVNVAADNGATILNPRCDPSQIPTYSLDYTPPATVNNSVMFDWSNNILISNTYNFTYSIQGGPVVVGTTGTSHWLVPNMLPGQSATLILSSASHPCVPSQTIICSVPCGSSTVTPTFNPILPFCAGTPAPSLPATSIEGITGTWSPATISNTASGNYVFTPDPIAYPCALPKTVSVTVTPLVAPTFSGIPAVVCQGAPAPVLPLISSNATPITGTWSPFPVNTATLGTTVYTFTPTPGQPCVSATLTTTSIRIDPVLTPTFAPVGPICTGTTLSALPTTSTNGITGTWSPALNNTATTTYTFTPTAGQCATTTTITITVNPNVVPTFAPVGPICSGAALPPLPTVSTNGINGTWSPATINNTATTTYTFTPSAGQCATNTTMTIVVNPLIDPNFTDLSICSGSTPPNLDLVSPNGITGTWSPSSIDNTTSGAYVFTPDAPQCATIKTINVTVNPSNTLQTLAWAVTDAFTKNQIVTITATAAGNYLYQLDSGPFQTSPVFENVASGMHSITVKDVNGCSTPLTENDILIIGYPKYFTPNGDAYNDTWNIFELKDQLATKIYIFDRYGKLLKDISPTGAGWDGTYIGQPMPASDYWFTVEYEEQGIVKKYKSHFSLKR